MCLVFCCPYMIASVKSYRCTYYKRLQRDSACVCVWVVWPFCFVFIYLLFVFFLFAFPLVPPLKVDISKVETRFVAGESSEIRCQTFGSRPAASISWWKDNVRLSDSSYKVSALCHSVPCSVSRSYVSYGVPDSIWDGSRPRQQPQPAGQTGNYPPMAVPWPITKWSHTMSVCVRYCRGTLPYSWPPLLWSSQRRR